MTRQDIRRQVLVPLTLTFLVLLGTFFYSSLRIRHINIVQDLDHRYEGVRELSRELQGQRGELLEALARVVADDEILRQAMADRDRDILLDRSLPVFKDLKSRHGLSHMYFHTPEAMTFLRAHHPERYGDRIDRHTLDTARSTGQTSMGAELGPLGTFTLRLVYPWYVEGELLGYIELGEVLDRIIQQLKNITGVEFIVAIKKNYLDRPRWEEHRRLLGRPLDWDMFPDKAVSEMTLDEMPEGVLEALAYRSAGLQSAFNRVSLGERTFVLRIFPLHDVSGYEVGDFVLLYDISPDVQMFNQFIGRVFAFGVFLCLGLFVFAYRILGRTDRKLAVTQDKLLAEITNANQINERLQTEIAVRRRAEENLRLLNEELEQRVDERTAELRELNAQIEASRQELAVAYEDLKAKQATILHQDKMACIGLLAAGVAHDINNPIGFVASNLSELQEYMPKIRRVIALQDKLLESVDAASSLMEELEAYREQIEFDHILEDLEILVQESLEGSERVSKIVQNLRTFSRVDDASFEPADINECLESTINITANELRYKAVVHRDYGNLPAVTCYPQQLNQVFMNLLINAAHAIDERGEVRVSTWAQDDSVMIRIADTGCGIAPQALEKIFEPFFTTKEIGKGTGLGLSITYDIISRHRGEINVESEIGHGTAFTIRLPIRGEEQAHG